MKFYRVKFITVDKNETFYEKIIYLFSPLRTEGDVSRYMFNVWAGSSPNGFIVKSIEEISLETFTKENEENLQTMVLSIIEED